jgi:hypothetical protein
MKFSLTSFFVEPCFLQQSILFQLSIVPYQKIRETHEHGWHFKKVEHHTSKIKEYMCARVIPNEIFPSLFLGRAMLSATTNFSLALHCSC